MAELGSAGNKKIADDGAQAAEAREIAALQARDREVRSHEQAHSAAGGEFVTGGIQFSYQRGPDGRYYAVGGEVSISSSAIAGDPEATLRKMAVVRRAAMAPAEPSAQDLAVAAQAATTASQASVELARQQSETQAADTPQGHRPSSADSLAVRAYGANSQQRDSSLQVLDLRA